MEWQKRRLNILNKIKVRFDFGIFTNFLPSNSPFWHLIHPIHFWPDSCWKIRIPQRKNTEVFLKNWSGIDSHVSSICTRIIRRLYRRNRLRRHHPQKKKFHSSFSAVIYLFFCRIFCIISTAIKRSSLLLCCRAYWICFPNIRTFG